LARGACRQLFVVVIAPDKGAMRSTAFAHATLPARRRPAWQR
jgi:hypothetical protein